jgi:hypothetical protein
MKISEICSIVEGEVFCGKEYLNEEVASAFASDLMSDVLTIKHCDFMLITGLVNLQAIRTAEMSDIRVILFVRNKTIEPEMIEVAEENDMIIIRSPLSMFKTSGLLYSAGLKPVY